MIKNFKSRLAEVGKIKIGGRGEERKGKKGMYQLPVRYGHFVVTTTEKDLKTGNFIEDQQIMELLDPRDDWKDGQQRPEPKEIPIVFLFDDIDMNFNTSYAFYQGAKCLCRGDGEEANMLFTKSGTPSVFSLIDDGPKKVEAGNHRKIICDPDTCPMMQPDAKGATKCKPSGILTCMISHKMDFGGVYRFRTHSWNTISNILGSLEFIKTITGGVLVGLPMKLQFLKKSTTDHGNVSVVNVAFDGKDREAMRQLAFTEMEKRESHNINMKQIETAARQSGIMDDHDDPKDVEDEFYSNPPEPEQPETIQGRAEAVLTDVEPVPEEETVEEPEAPAEPEATTEQTVEDVPAEEETPATEEKPAADKGDGLEIF